MTTEHAAPGCPHVELAVAWALHALEPAEEVQVAAHLPDCAECTRVVAETEEVGAMLGLSVSDSEPSAELQDRVLAIQQVEQQPSPEPACGDRPADEATERPDDSRPDGSDPDGSRPDEMRPDHGRSGEPLPGIGDAPHLELPSPRVPIPHPQPLPGLPPRPHGRWHPACWPEPILMVVVVLLTCLLSVVIVYFLV